MKEVLANTISNVYYDIFVSGVPTAATGSVVAVVVKDGITISTISSATAVDGKTGRYQITLPMAAVVTEGLLEIDWSFHVGSTALTVKDYYGVITPYASFSYFNDAGTSFADYVECERVARYVINAYCGQEFGQQETSYAIEGTGNDSLRLPRKLITFNDISWSTGYSRPGSVISWDIPEWEIAGSGWTLRTQPNEIHINPVRNPEAIFRRNVLYNVEGLWGYISVPTSVEEAAKIVIADYLCVDHKYRDKYLDSIKMGDWRIQFAPGAWMGTGNATADQLLMDYRNYPGIGIV